MNYIIYETICLVNNKKYIGYHATENIDDNYLGSGKYLKSAIKKYGKDQFIKRILFIFDSKEEALKKEKELVNEKFINDKNTYNLKIGGEGGFDYINKELIKDPEFMRKKGDKISKSLIELYKKGKLVGWQMNKTPGRINGFKGKKHTEETKKQMSLNNSMNFGNMLNERINDYINIDKKFGYIMKLSNKWNVSHTQVRRFINKYC